MYKKDLKSIAKKLQLYHTDSIKALLDYMLEAYNVELYGFDRKDLAKCVLVSSSMPDIELAHNIHVHDNRISHVLKKLMLHRVPTLEKIYDDLLCIDKEFNGISFDSNGLLVTTKDIILNDVNFGQFDILFDMSDPNINGRDFYTTKYVTIIALALKPLYPKSGDEEYTHPHVSSDELCVGRGVGAIKDAMIDLRLLDYFTIINNILNTYGTGPHIPIEEWTGERCNNCEDCSDYSYTCYQCNDLYCDSCIKICVKCENNICELCLDDVQCSVRECDCSNNICESCLSYCNVCNKTVCGPEQIDCGCSICPNCFRPCVSCGKDCCEHCVSFCESCEDSTCEECISECHKCHAVMCKNCVSCCECE